VIRDNRWPFLISLVDCFAFAESQSKLCPPKPGNPATFCLSSVVYLAYLLYASDSAPAWTWTHVFAPSNSEKTTLRARSRPGGFLCLRALGLCLTWLGWLGSHDWLGLA
jgi:hypothetical protein